MHGLHTPMGMCTVHSTLYIDCYFIEQESRCPCLHWPAAYTIFIRPVVKLTLYAELRA